MGLRRLDDQQRLDSLQQLSKQSQVRTCSGVPLLTALLFAAVIAVSCGGSEPTAKPEPPASQPAPTFEPDADAEPPASQPALTSEPDVYAEPRPAESISESTDSPAELDATILATPSTGSLTIGGTTHPLVDLAFVTADLGYGQADTIAATSADETLVLVPLDLGTWTPSGDEFMIDLPNGDQLTGPNAQLVVAAPRVTFSGNVTALDGSSTTVSFTLEINAGTSVFELDGTHAVLTGTLGANTYRQMRYLIENHPEVDTLVLQLINGSVDDNINVDTGRLVRNAELATVVPSGGKIYSGGVDLFAAGIRRIAEPGAIVGVHSWCCDSSGRTADQLDVDDPAHDSLIAYLTEMLGGSYGKDFYYFTIRAAPFDQIHVMTQAELTQYLVTDASGWDQ